MFHIIMYNTLAQHSSVQVHLVQVLVNCLVFLERTEVTKGSFRGNILPASYQYRVMINLKK